ncbi:hypothetical protein PVAP13_9NG087300 [Panicum virgatum]|uniref:Uncharacterized protein n=1 Tax=Panicum virgatum TaxID=38727 RepID=A0A8T0MC82_PANVG|nr:hypothetical protein PVAP13_9NG087300 [Panicum virgatum]
MATRNSRAAARLPAAAALLLLPPLLILATTVSLASAARPTPANPIPQPASLAPAVATDVEQGEVVSVAAGIGTQLVTKASPSDAPPGIETSVVVIFPPPGLA